MKCSTIFSTFIFSFNLLLIIVNSQDPLKADIKDLFKLLDHVPPKGVPFPRIAGPHPTDRVCIVGAGPSGIHMALSLKKRGYKNVTIYEKTNRVGGKSYDITYRNVAQPQGAFLLTPSYFDTVVPLAKQYGVGDLKEIPSPNIWMTNSSQDSGSKLTGAQFLLGSLQQITNEKSSHKNLAALLNTLNRYIQIHKDLFGSYKGALMQKPSKTVMDRISGTFFDFLERENLLVLSPMLSLTTTSVGYGNLDEISALYGLMHNEPRLMISVVLLLTSGEGISQDPFNVYFLKNGFEAIWKTIVHVEDLDVRFNVDLYSMKRRTDKVYLKLWKGSYLEKKVCDFLIWTAPMSALLRTLSDASHLEYSVLGSLKPTIYTANLVNMKNDVRNGPYVKHYGTFNNKVDHGVASELDVAGISTPNIKTSEAQNQYNKNKHNIRTLLVVQLGKDYSNKNDLNEGLVKHYKEGFNATHVEILNTISWSYFPRWNPEETNQGRHWKVFDMQGSKKMWYAGSSVSFESIKDVLEYNNLLLRQML